ncbi:Limonoid UDP-glucosyltransferase [Dorcoceras hygrometricum]|uniref:Limonoid UDP-glucosyltransferase n=1 Tax=Dorcoceras hygrometricum TaxID=472368 RepID=A0A2Z7A2M8_9LAMI|nr:Limonoid UDP-glucosyltransferase [Dorcoceras hygrometricum]
MYVYECFYRCIDRSRAQNFKYSAAPRERDPDPPLCQQTNHDLMTIHMLEEELKQIREQSRHFCAQSRLLIVFPEHYFSVEASVQHQAQSVLEEDQAPVKTIEHQAQDYTEEHRIESSAVEHQALVAISEHYAQSGGEDQPTLNENIQGKQERLKIFGYQFLVLVIYISRESNSDVDQELHNQYLAFIQQLDIYVRS